MVWQVLAGLGMGALSAFSGASSQSAARRAEQKRIDNQYKYDTTKYEFDWKQTKDQYRYLKTEAETARSNQENNLRFQETTNLRDYQYTLAIRDYDHNNQLRQYNESERIYGAQLGYNNQAAAVAQAAQNRQYQEILSGMAFDQQDMFVKMLQEEGQLQARGVSGKSADKALGSALAGFGRNQAIMAESLMSANREFVNSSRQIQTDKFGADLSAQSRRMLSPIKGPAPFAPLVMPRAKIMDPNKPKKGPAPIKGVNTMPANNGLAIANNFVNAGLGAYQMFGGKFG